MHVDIRHSTLGGRLWDAVSGFTVWREISGCYTQPHANSGVQGAGRNSLTPREKGKGRINHPAWSRRSPPREKVVSILHVASQRATSPDLGSPMDQNLGLMLSSSSWLLLPLLLLDPTSLLTDSIKPDSFEVFCSIFRDLLLLLLTTNIVVRSL